LKATEQPIDTSTAAGKCFLDMLGVFGVAGGEEPYIVRRRVVEIRKGPVWGTSDCGVQND
jgi:hypothetical protein